MPKLWIRNLTVNPLELIKLERFEAKSVATGNALSNVTGAITGFMNATVVQNSELVTEGHAKNKRDVDNVRIGPFKAEETDVQAPNPDNEVVRLVFKTEGHKYETDVPSRKKQSSVMKKLDGGPHDLTVVYVPKDNFVAVFSSAKLNKWMRELDDDWPITVLSVPGTHNSPTCHTALPSVRCQAVGVKEQLDNGVRFLDIRVSADPGSDALALVHSAFPISLSGTKYFGDMLKKIYEFLDENKSETVIMSVKREGTGKGTDQDVSKYIKNSYVEKNEDKWYTKPKVPKLGDARGKIVLVRRYGLAPAVNKVYDGKGYGIDAQNWPDNCEDGKIGNGHIHVQDFYEITESQNINKKINYSCGQLERAAAQMYKITGMGGHKGDASIPPMYINFLSASNFFNASCWPERIAAKVNPAIVEYLCCKHGESGQGPHKLKVGSAGTGIVVTDWVGANDDWDLVRCIVGMNARLQWKQGHNDD